MPKNTNEIQLKNVRLSFPNIFIPQASDLKNDDGSPAEPKYNCEFIIDPKSDAWKVLMAEWERACAAEYGANWKAIVSSLSKERKCIKNGNNVLKKDGTIRDGYEGMMAIKASNKMPPFVCGRKTTKVFTKANMSEPADDRPFGGCYVNAKIIINPMLERGKMSKQVRATLMGIQFFAEGPAFGAAPGTAEGFEDIPDENENTSATETASSGSDDDMF